MVVKFGGKEARTVYTLRRKGTPRTMSAVSARESEAWMRPMQVEESVYEAEFGGGAVMSKGCKGIGGRWSRPIEIFMGVVQGT